METVSQKRGRPALHNPELLKLCRSLYPDITTERGLRDKSWEVLGLRLIHSDLSLKEWFEKKCESDRKFPAGILRELGAISHTDPDGALDLVKQWQSMGDATWAHVRSEFRRIRLGERRFSQLDLTNAILGTLNAYRKRFPKLTREQALAALDHARDVVDRTVIPHTNPKDPK